MNAMAQNHVIVVAIDMSFVCWETIMEKFKVTAWNIKHADKLVDRRHSDTARTKRHALARLDAITEEIALINADILFVSEGPKGEDRAREFFDIVAPDYRLVTRQGDDNGYGIDGGTQHLWFLIRRTTPIDARLMHIDRWQNMVEAQSNGTHKGGRWNVSFPVLNADDVLEFAIDKTWDHYRHPQVLQVEIDGAFVELIGCHLRSKHTSVKQVGDVTDDAFFANNKELVSELITDRVKSVHVSGSRTVFAGRCVFCPAVFLSCAV